MERGRIRVYTSTDLERLDELTGEIGFEHVAVRTRNAPEHKPVWYWNQSPARKDYWTPEVTKVGKGTEYHFSIQTGRFGELDVDPLVVQIYQEITGESPLSFVAVERVSLRLFLDEVTADNPILALQGRLGNPLVIKDDGKRLGSDLQTCC